MFRNFQSCCGRLCRNITTSREIAKMTRRNYSLYEPDYLEAMKSKIPLYGTLNIQMKGYDYPVLENYQKFVHRMAANMDIEVEDGWATPAQQIKVLRYKPQSNITDTEYKLSLYERNIQIVDVPTTVLAVLLEVLKSALPEGVKLSIHEHLPEHDEVRYVPDHELIELKGQLESMGGAKKK